MPREYRFIDKDPVIDEVRTVMERSIGAGSIAKLIRDVAAEARLARGTIRDLLYGKTQRPQHRTVQAIFDACGVKTRRFWQTGEEVKVAQDVWRRFTKAQRRGSNVVSIERRRA